MTPDPTTHPATHPATDPATWSRRRVLGAGAAAFGAALLAGCGLTTGSTPDASATTATDGFSGTLLDPPLAKPDTVFTDTEGKPFSLREQTKGELTLLFYGYTSCPDICPVYLNTLARARDALGGGPGSRAKVLFVGVDTARDTPAAMREYLDAFDPSFVGLTATPDEIADSLDQLKQAPPVIGEPDADGNYEVVHPARVNVFTPDGKAHRIYPYGVRRAAWVHDLPLLDEGRWQ